ARPLSVLLTLVPLGLVHRRFRFSGAEQTLLSWAGLKGAVPIILAIIPLLNEAPQSALIFNVVFVSVVVGTALQGMTIGPLARALGLTSPPRPGPPVALELTGAVPPGTSVLDVALDDTTPAVGQRLADLALPGHMVVAAIYREGRLVPPRGPVVFEPGDHVYLISETTDLESLPSAFRVPSSA
ncbi:MAG: TrkA C-terminal domain-containing protein, partial [Salinivenus sp.]